MRLNAHKAIPIAAGALLLGLTVAATSSSAGKLGLSKPKQTGPLELAPGATLELNGVSTLHPFKARALEMSAGIDFDAARVALILPPVSVVALIRGRAIRSLELTIPVAKLSSGEPGLDENLRDALKSDRFQEVRFRADSYDLVATPAAGAAFTVTLHGHLSLAGVERLVDVRADGIQTADGVRFSGSKDLLMSDFQVKPPTMMFGTIKTADLITVKFDVTLKIATTPPGIAGAVVKAR